MIITNLIVALPWLMMVLLMKVKGQYCPGAPLEQDIGRNGCLILLTEEETKPCVSIIDANTMRFNRDQARRTCKEKYQAFMIILPVPIARYREKDAQMLINSAHGRPGYLAIGASEIIYNANRSVMTITWDDGTKTGIRTSPAADFWENIDGGTIPFYIAGMSGHGEGIDIISPKESDVLRAARIFIICHKDPEAQPPPTPLTSDVTTTTDKAVKTNPVTFAVIVVAVVVMTSHGMM